MNVAIMTVLIFFLLTFTGCFSEAVNERDVNGDIQSAIKQLRKDIRSIAHAVREDRKAFQNLTDEIRENRKQLKKQEAAIKGLLKSPDGKSRTSPVKSCKWLKENGRNAKSGLYWVSLASPTQVYCDMDAGEGGWTMVGSAAIVDASKAYEVGYKKIMSDDISQLRQVTTKRFLLSASGLSKLKSYIGFTQIRLRCYKPWHARTLHIYTSNNTLGRSVVSFLLDKSDVRPQSCGSYARFADDSSYIGKDCSRWYRGKWYSFQTDRDGGRMYCYPMFINRKSHFSLGQDGAFECDDYGRDSGYNTIGEWSFYVR